METGHAFQESQLPELLEEFNQRRQGVEPMPWLAALVCCSAFDIALHDAYGTLHELPVYKTYNSEFMNADLSDFITPAEGSRVTFRGKYPEDFLVLPRPDRMPAWHLVGGKDLIDRSELDGTEPDDGYPVLLPDWIQRDGLKCLLLRKVGKAVRESFEDLRRKILVKTDHQYLRSDAVLKLANGSRIILGHFRNEGDIDAYLGLEYHVVGDAKKPRDMLEAIHEGHQAGLTI